MNTTPYTFEQVLEMNPDQFEIRARDPVMWPIADDALPFSVWRETRILPRRRLAAFRVQEDASRFSEMRARIEGENDCNVDTTIWMSRPDGSEVLIHRFSSIIRAA